jgi:hypothetical protein
MTGKRLTGLQQQKVAAVMRTCPPQWTARQYARFCDISISTAVIILERFGIPYWRGGMQAVRDANVLKQGTKDALSLAKARAQMQMQKEIDAAHVERASVEPFRCSDAEWESWTQKRNQ